MPLVSRVLDPQPVRSLREYTDRGGGEAAASARQAAPREVIDLLRSSGLRGRGGAGFPTGAKWEAVASSGSAVAPTAVVVNAAEGEPGTFKDRALLRTNPYRVLEGAIVAARAMQTDQVRIGIKASFGREIERLQAAIAEMARSGWLGDLDVELVLGPSSYLFGEETGLLEVIEGRQPFPRVTPPYRRGLNDDDTRSVVGVPLATSEGAGGPPALVDNVETLANVPLIIDRGAEWFRAVGTDRSPGTIVCTVSGATRRNGVGEVAMGSTLRSVIDDVGWGPQRGREIQIVLAGTANPLIPSQLLDTPLTYEAMRDAGSGLGSAGFIVFDDTADPVAVAAGVARFLAVESCGQCEPCKTDGLFIADHLRRAVQDPAATPDLATLRRRIGTVAIGARCNLAQQQASVATSLLELFPHHLRARGPAAATDPITIAPIADLIGGRAVLDGRQATKQPDWSYGSTDSGAAPAALLGNTPVRLVDGRRPRQWPEWSAEPTADHPLELIDDAHEEIQAQIDGILDDGPDDGPDDGAVDEVVLAIRTHIDVTQRVLYPMARRFGEEDGDRLADAAEAQERTLSALVADLSRSGPGERLRDLCAELQEHARLDDEVLALLRKRLDPSERSSLADGLAAARTTSTVSRLRRTASTVPSPATVAAPSSAAPHIEPAPPDTALPPPQPSTIHRVLVGVDGSTSATAALEWAGRLAQRVGAEVVVGNVFEATQAELHPGDLERLLAESERRLDGEWAKPARDLGIRVRGLQLVGAPDRLLDAAAEERASLLVVGTRGAGRFAGLHLGSLAHHLAHHTRGPLAIIPLAGATAAIDRLVVGVDGSDGSSSAVAWCADLARATQVEVVAVCAVRRQRDVNQETIDEEWLAPLRASGAPVQTRIVETHHPVAAISGTAEDEDAGLVVVGTRGLSKVAGLRLGRLPLQLVHHTHLPVLLVPPAA